MGVHGLWQLLQPAGRPVSLESLEGKVLAVDVSIWLHQTMKGMRDKDGNPLPNAHLQGLFSRICKLLFYRIKPIFIFDGGVPVLKKQTMVARRERKTEAERESSDIAQKLLRNLVRSQAVKQALGDGEGPPVRIPGVRKGNNKQEQDIFQLNPLPEAEERGLAMNAEEWERDFEQQENWIKEGLAAVSDTHPDSKEFKSLPMEIQHEILNEMREQKKYHSLSRLTKMPEDSDDFSSYQLKKLMKKSKLTMRIEEVRKEMTNKTSSDITYTLGDDYYGDEVEARRIVSEDASHYVLIKGMSKRKQLEEAEKYELQKKVKMEKEEEGDDSYGGGSTSGTGEIKKETVDARNTGQSLKVSVSSSDSDDDVETIMARRFRRKKAQKRKKPPVSGKIPSGRKDKAVSSKRTKVISSDEEDEKTDGKIEEIKSHPVIAAGPAGSSSSSEDEGFIEVSVDPNAAMEEDELFPASIFQTSIEPDTVGMMSSHSDSDDKASDKPPKHFISLDMNKKAEVMQNSENKQGSDSLISHSGPDISSANRKSVLNDVLSQLQEKKKSLQDSIVDMDVEMNALQAETDSSLGGGFIPEEEDDEERHVEIKHEKSPNGHKSFDTVSKPTNYSGFESSRNPDSMKENLMNFSQAAAVSDEEDDDLKLAIELSLQSSKSEGKITDEDKKDFSQGTSKFRNLEKDDEDLGVVKLLGPQKSTQGRQSQSSSLDERGDDFQKEEETTKNKITETGSEYHDSGGNDNNKSGANVGKSDSQFEENLRKAEISPVKPSQDRPQPEDFEVDDDVDTYFQAFNEDDLMDMNSELQSERQTLLSERGRQTRMATSVTEQTNLEAQELLRLFGLPYIISPMEAEAQCAFLDLTDQTQGTVTDDSDIWLFGGRRMYKNFFNQNKHVEFFSFDSIHNHFGLGREQLINIALLCGSDYTEGIQGVGPVRALEIMAEFPGEGLGGLYMFRKWWDKAQKSFTSAPGNKVRARLKDLKVIPGFPSEAVVDAYMNPTVDESTERFSWGSPDLDMLREFAKHRFGWPKDKTDKSLIPMMKQLSQRQSQGRIHSYFQPENFIQTAKIKSDRLKKALEMVKNPRQGGQVSEEGNSRVANDESISHEEKTERIISSSKKKGKERKKKRKEKLEESEEDEKNVESKKTGQEIKQKTKSGGKVSESPPGGQKGKMKQKKQEDSNKTLTPQKVASEVQVENDNNQEPQIDAENAQADGMIRNEKHTEDREGFMGKMSEKVRQALSKLEGEQSQGKGGGIKKVKDTVGGRSKMVVSLDQKVKPRKGRSSKRTRGGIRTSVRGAFNLSESSSSESDGSDANETVASKVSGTGSSFSQGQARQPQGRKNSSKNVIGKPSQIKTGSAGTPESKTSEEKAPKLEKKSPKDQGVSQVQSKKGNEYKQLAMNEESMKSDSHPNLLSKQKSLNKKTKDAAEKTVPKSKASPVSGPTDMKNLSLNIRGKISDTKIAAPSRQQVTKDDAATTPSTKVTKSKNDGETSILNTMKISPYSSAALALSVQEDGNNGRGQESKEKDEDTEEIDMSKADVSIINRQNLPATLAYLNKRSREDTFLLHQLRGSRAKNAIEQRLEESERRGKIEKEKVEIRVRPTKAVSEEIMSFEDMLGGMDQVVREKVQKQNAKKSGKSSVELLVSKDEKKVSSVKKLPGKTKKQISSFGTSFVELEDRASKKDNQTGSTKKSLKPPQNTVLLPSQGCETGVKNSKETSMEKYSKVRKSNKAEESEKRLRQSRKVGFGSSDESIDFDDGLLAESMEGDKDRKLLKSNRSLAFDKPLGMFEDNDEDLERYSRKRNKFQKQMEHLGDSRSVKGHGIISRSAGSGLTAGRAFAGKGKGRGKNRNGRQGFDVEGGEFEPEVIESSKQPTDEELMQYRDVTADDLGSDFSDGDF